MPPNDRMDTTPDITAPERSRSALLARGVALEYFTIGYNAFEGVVAILAGVLAGSVALVGFGLDSVIEIAAGMTLLWRLRRETQIGADISEAEHSSLERRALLIIGVTFFALSAYIAIEAGYMLVTGGGAEESTVGIILAVASLVIMPALAFLKQRTARGLNSHALAADAMETWVCSYLSLILLAGLGLNAAFGWGWADPLAALAMLPLVIKEGWEAFEEGREE
ncbi:MAG: cation transporter [Thermoleophilia bacterium]|nr:cation transporter [Thermoleophilia bacterium]